MDNKKVNEGKQILANELKKEANSDKRNGFWTYILYEVMMDQRFYEITEDQGEELMSQLETLGYGFVDYLEKNFADGFTKDFDLFYLCANTVSKMTKELEDEKVRTIFTDILMAVEAGVFRMWFDKITNRDIIAYLEGKPHRELPDMRDASATFAWAMEQNIPCSDMVGLYKKLEVNELSEEEGRKLREGEEKMKRSFDDIIPLIVKDGVPQSFVDENLGACRSMYVNSRVLYYAMPLSMEAEKIIENDKLISRLFERVCHTLTEKDIKACVNDANKMFYLQKIFKIGFIVSQYYEEHGGLGRAGMYKAMAKEAKRDRKGD